MKAARILFSLIAVLPLAAHAATFQYSVFFDSNTGGFQFDTATGQYLDIGISGGGESWSSANPISDAYYLRSKGDTFGRVLQLMFDEQLGAKGAGQSQGFAYVVSNPQGAGSVGRGTASVSEVPLPGTLGLLGLGLAAMGMVRRKHA